MADAVNLERLRGRLWRSHMATSPVTVEVTMLANEWAAVLAALDELERRRRSTVRVRGVVRAMLADWEQHRTRAISWAHMVMKLRRALVEQADELRRLRARVAELETLLLDARDELTEWRRYLSDIAVMTDRGDDGARLERVAGLVERMKEQKGNDRG